MTMVRRALLAFAAAVTLAAAGVSCTRPSSGRPGELAPAVGAPTSPSTPIISAIVAWECMVVSPFPATTCEPARSRLLQMRFAGLALVAPANPVALNATVAGHAITLTWTAPGGGDPPTSYVVEAGSAAGLLDLANFDTGNAAPALTANDVPSGSYFVRVQAKNSAGLSQPSNEIVVTVAGGASPCATLPGSPTGLTAQVSGSTLTLTWSAPGGGCAPTGYVLEAGSSAGLANLANLNTGSVATTFTATGVGAGTYFVRVRTSNGVGASAPSNEASFTIGGGPIPVPTPACGVERWAVKTLADADAMRVNSAPVATTIAALNALDAHCSGLPDARTYGPEFHVYEVTGIVQVARHEDDQDFHVALADPNDLSQTIVVELADPGCASQSPYVSAVAQARSQFLGISSIVGTRVTVRGVGFYDFAHGQTGRSRSCIELHPVINIVLAATLAPTPIPTPTPTPGSPPSATTSAASALSTTAATLNGIVSPNGLATSAFFQWGLTAAYGIATASQTGSGTSAVNVASGLADLASATSYHYRLVATNSAGTTSGSDVTFTTSTPAPTPTPTRTRIGATCRDGTSSTATGSGACSSHGGVLCWRYSDGTCTNP